MKSVGGIWSKSEHLHSYVHIVIPQIEAAVELSLSCLSKKVGIMGDFCFYLMILFLFGLAISEDRTFY